MCADVFSSCLPPTNHLPFGGGSNFPCRFTFSGFPRFGFLIFEGERKRKKDNDVLIVMLPQCCITTSSAILTLFFSNTVCTTHTFNFTLPSIHPSRIKSKPVKTINVSISHSYIHMHVINTHIYTSINHSVCICIFPRLFVSHPQPSHLLSFHPLYIYLVKIRLC